MTGRRASVALAVLLAVSLLAGAGAVTAQEGDDWSAPGPFPIEELRQGGASDPDAPDSARMLGSPVRGSAAFRHTPVSPLKSGWKYLDPGSLLQSDTLQFYTNAYGEAAGDYTLVVVYWNEETKRVNGTDVTYAADQTVQRINLEVPEGYATQTIELKSHYDQKVQVTAWLERDGEVVDGARWRFQHRSNPLTASPEYPINGKGDIWRWAGINIFFPAIPGVLIGRFSARHVLDKTIVGPQKGVVWWGIVLAVISFIALGVGTWQTAAVLARAPYVAGIFIAVFSFAAFLGFRDRDVERAEFNQKDLESVTALSGSSDSDTEDDLEKRARSEDIRLIDIVRRDGNIYAPSKGLRPFFARYWAEPAAVDETDLVTVNNTTGDVSKKYELDPYEDKPLVRKPATLSFEPQLFVEERPDPLFDLDEDASGWQTTPFAVVNAITGFFRSLNPRFLAPAILGGALAYLAVKAWIGVPAFAGMAALLPVIIAGYSAKDGRLEVDEAPYHFSRARAILAHERAQYNEASTFEALQENIADMDLDEFERVQDTIDAFQDRMNERLNEFQGGGSAGTGSGDDS